MLLVRKAGEYLYRLKRVPVSLENVIQCVLAPAGDRCLLEFSNLLVSAVRDSHRFSRCVNTTNGASDAKHFGIKNREMANGGCDWNTELCRALRNFDGSVHSGWDRRPFR